MSTPRLSFPPWIASVTSPPLPTVPGDTEVSWNPSAAAWMVKLLVAPESELGTAST